MIQPQHPTGGRDLRLIDQIDLDVGQDVTEKVGETIGERAMAPEDASGNTPIVFVTRMLPGHLNPGSPLDRLRQSFNVDVWPDEKPPTAEEFRKKLRTASAVVTTIAETVDDKALEDASHLKVIAQLGVGYDNIDVALCNSKGIFVTNTPDVVTDATADLTWALLLAATRRIKEANDAIRTSKWGPWHPSWMLGQSIKEKTLGIVGPGRIGQAVAERAQGFRMKILYHGTRPKDAFPGSFSSLEALLSESDFVSVHLPLNASTTEYCDRNFFGAMKPTGIFINTGRGGLVNQSALHYALTNNVITAAALDVTTPEPLPATHELMTLPNCMITPHIGSATHEARLEMANMAVDSIIESLQGGTPATKVTL